LYGWTVCVSWLVNVYAW